MGLNLTRATLDATCKYPWPRSAAVPAAGAHADGTPRGIAKFGVYDDDLPVFSWVREGVVGERRCLEAQVMDLSDDIAYSVHDVEDGVVAGRIDLPALGDVDLRAEVWETVRAWYLPDAPDAELEQSFSVLREQAAWPKDGHSGSRADLAALKNLTSTLIGRFCAGATAATRATAGEGPLTRYDADLVVPRETAVEIAILKGIAAHLVMQAEDRMAQLERQRELLAELFDAVAGRAPEVLQPPFRLDYHEAIDGAGRLRVVADQVASLTDGSAVAWHRRLTRRTVGAET